MPVVYASIAPHGGEAIREIATRSTLGKFQVTRGGLQKVASEIARTRPDTVVIATPHSLRLQGHIGIITTENSSGVLHASPQSKASVNLTAKCDQKFATQLLELATKRKLPVIGANYGTSEGPESNMPMDWGTLVPLWFIMKQHNSGKPKVVIVTPSREIPLRQNYEFGRAIGDLAERSRKRYVFVASADQAHAHKKSGPYGFSRAAATYDRIVVNAIQTNRMHSIMNLNPKLVEDAKPDSLWQMTMLAGVLSRVHMRSELFSYQVPTYYGMACAGFRRTTRRLASRRAQS